MKLGKYLKKLRLEQNLSMREISEKIGISLVVYCKIENDDWQYDLSFKTVSKLCEYTGLTPKELREME